jgi:prepilin-type N-terminal cleavage/methylation domain-containing protein
MYPNRKINRQDGFSMIELMISMAIMTIVTGAAFALIGSSIKFSSATYHLADTEQGLRSAQEIINRDLTTAGDGLKGIGTIQLPLAFVQSYLTQTPVVISGNPNYVNMALVTSDDNVPGTTAVPQASPAATVLGGTDRLTILTEDYTSFPLPVTVLAGKITSSTPNTTIVVPSTDIGKFQAGEMYALLAQNSAAFFVISSVNSSTNTLTVTNGDVYSINQTGTGTPINVVSVGGTAPSTIVRIQMIHYFVNSNNLLIRRVFGVKGATFVDNVIAEHVTKMQFRYLVNLTDVNGFVPQPLTQLATSQQQLAVREVETTIAVETLRAVTAITANNNTGKQVISSTTATSVRNLQFRQAL